MPTAPTFGMCAARCACMGGDPLPLLRHYRFGAAPPTGAAVAAVVPANVYLVRSVGGRDEGRERPPRLEADWSTAACIGHNNRTLIDQRATLIAAGIPVGAVL